MAQRRTAAAAAITMLLAALQFVLLSVNPTPAGATSSEGVHYWHLPGATNTDKTCAALDDTYADGGTTWTEVKFEGSDLASDKTLQGITLDNFAGTSVSWSATLGIDAVVVKSGTSGASFYVYDGLTSPSDGSTVLSTGSLRDSEETSDSNLESPGAEQAISHISFCYDRGDAPAPGSIVVTKTASPTQVTAPGGTVTFTVEVENTSGVEVTINDIVDDKFGVIASTTQTVDVATTDCAVSQTLAASDGTTGTGGDYYSCTFDGSVTGEAGTAHTNTVTASGVDANQNEVSDDDDAVVNIVAAPTSTTPTTPTTVATEVASITVVKSAAGAGDQDFAFSFDDASFTLQNGESETFSDLDAGTYSVAEVNDVPADASEARWSLVQVECTDGSTANIAADGSDGRAVIALQEGENVTCTFTNVLVAGIQIESTTTTVAPTTTIAPVTTDTLPFTGFETEEMLVLGLVVMTAGGLLLFAASRREQDGLTTESLPHWNND